MIDYDDWPGIIVYCKSISGFLEIFWVFELITDVIDWFVALFCCVIEN